MTEQNVAKRNLPSFKAFVDMSDSQQASFTEEERKEIYIRHEQSAGLRTGIVCGALALFGAVGLTLLAATNQRILAEEAGRNQAFVALPLFNSHQVGIIPKDIVFTPTQDRPSFYAWEPVRNHRGHLILNERGQQLHRSVSEHAANPAFNTYMTQLEVILEDVKNPETSSDNRLYISKRQATSPFHIAEMGTRGSDDTFCWVTSTELQPLSHTMATAVELESLLNTYKDFQGDVPVAAPPPTEHNLWEKTATILPFNGAPPAPVLLISFLVGGSGTIACSVISMSRSGNQAEKHEARLKQRLAEKQRS